MAVCGGPQNSIGNAPQSDGSHKYVFDGSCKCTKVWIALGVVQHFIFLQFSYIAMYLLVLLDLA